MTKRRRYRAAHSFLSRLYRNRKENMIVGIFSLPAGTMKWFTSIEEAAEFIANSKCDVYVQACLCPIGLMRGSNSHKIRGKKTNVVGMPGLWADIDRAHEVHSNSENLPPDIPTAMKVLERLPRPSYLILSGHGLQGWWLFADGVWHIKDDKIRRRASQLSQGFNKVLKQFGEQSNFKFDSTFDLARVMRCPGSMNYKDPKDVKEVRLIRRFGPYYQVEQLEAFVRDNIEADSGASVRLDLCSSRAANVDNIVTDNGAHNFVIRADARPPKEKLEAALCNLDSFSLTWNFDRKSEFGEDVSSYDMSIANHLVQAGWSDQEVVDAVIAFRRNRGKPKLRRSYLALTLSKAKANIVRPHFVWNDSHMDDAEMDDGGDEQRWLCEGGDDELE